MTAVILLAVCCMLMTQVTGYPTGAPAGACITLTPNHGGTVAQTGPNNYTLTVDMTTVDGSGNVKVTLSASEGSMFRGFLVEARCTTCSTANTAIVSGTFSKMAAADPTKTLDCPGGTANAMTHTDRTDKQTVAFTWTAPSVSSNTQIEFRAVVVQETPVWWNNVRSVPLTLNASSSASISVRVSVLATVIMFLSAFLN